MEILIRVNGSQNYIILKLAQNLSAKKYKKFDFFYQKTKTFIINELNVYRDKINYKQIDNGAYSIVYKAINKITGKQVAIKKMKKKYIQSQKLQFRELKILQNINSQCIIKLEQWIIDSYGILHLIFQYFEENLLNLYLRLNKKRKRNFSLKQIKCIIIQVTIALKHLHQNNIIHRDIKPQNILVNKNTRQVKLTDFGLSKFGENYNTQYVSTRWYRAPQLILRYKKYNHKVDIFALGCIMAQLYMSKQLFPGKTTVDQIYKIFQILGTPQYHQWPLGYQLFQNCGQEIPVFQKIPLNKVFSQFGQDGLNLLQKMLQINPQKRIDAQQIINHRFFFDILNYLPKNVLQQRQTIIKLNNNSNKQSQFRKLKQKNKSQTKQNTFIKKQTQFDLNSRYKSIQQCKTKNLINKKSNIIANNQYRQNKHLQNMRTICPLIKINLNDQSIEKNIRQQKTIQSVSLVKIQNDFKSKSPKSDQNQEIINPFYSISYN